MNVVTLTGSEGALGKRVLKRLQNIEEITKIVLFDRARGSRSDDERLHVHRVDLLDHDLETDLAGSDTLIHLASVISPEKQARGGESAELELTRRALEAAAVVGVAHLVIVSSAAVYGAHPDNPVPMVEDTPLRPNEGFAFAEVKAEIEKLVEQFLLRHPNTSITVLRPTVTVAEDGLSWLGEALASVPGVAAGDSDPPVQFLHFDDLAAAVVLAAEKRLDGVFNVAPDAWISPDAMGAFRTLPKPRVPLWVADNLAKARQRVTTSAPPAAILPLVVYPWVVANDRLKQAGWRPSFTNEEAYISFTKPGPFDTISPKRRQELALGVAGSVLVGTGVAIAAVIRRQMRLKK